VVKQHGGKTATGQDISKIIADVGHQSVRMFYDAAIIPKDEDCGPGFGEAGKTVARVRGSRTGRPRTRLECFCLRNDWRMI
jgi:hypothetical protein